jgi:hypothetical protein
MNTINNYIYMKTIRLTESDLHNIIKESVNKVLAELDWRTCTSSALERCKRSGYKSDLAQKDIQHAVKTANKQQSKNREEFDQDFKDYFNGKTQYVKGKGWVKVKESINRVIKESVNKVLTELDWKTYQNARRKASNKREYDKALRFGNAAQKEFNNIYGKDGVHGDIFLNRVSSESDSYPSHTLMHMYDYDGEGNYSNPYNYDYTKALGIMDEYDTDGRYKRVKNPSLKRFFNNSEQENAYKAASKEMDDYVMGNYNYSKGKGWTKK